MPCSRALKPWFTGQGSKRQLFFAKSTEALTSRQWLPHAPCIAFTFTELIAFTVFTNRNARFRFALHTFPNLLSVLTFSMSLFSSYHTSYFLC